MPAPSKRFSPPPRRRRPCRHGEVSGGALGLLMAFLGAGAEPCLVDCGEGLDVTAPVSLDPTADVLAAPQLVSAEVSLLPKACTGGKLEALACAGVRANAEPLGYEFGSDGRLVASEALVAPAAVRVADLGLGTAAEALAAEECGADLLRELLARPAGVSETDVARALDRPARLRPQGLAGADDFVRKHVGRCEEPRRRERQQRRGQVKRQPPRTPKVGGAGRLLKGATRFAKGAAGITVLAEVLVRDSDPMAGARRGQRDVHGRTVKVYEFERKGTLMLETCSGLNCAETLRQTGQIVPNAAGGKIAMTEDGVVIATFSEGDGWMPVSLGNPLFEADGARDASYRGVGIPQLREPEGPVSLKLVSGAGIAAVETTANGTPYEHGMLWLMADQAAGRKVFERNTGERWNNATFFTVDVQAEDGSWMEYPAALRDGTLTFSLPAFVGHNRPGVPALQLLQNVLAGASLPEGLGTIERVEMMRGGYPLALPVERQLGHDAVPQAWQTPIEIGGEALFRWTPRVMEFGGEPAVVFYNRRSGEHTTELIVGADKVSLKASPAGTDEDGDPRIAWHISGFEVGDAGMPKTSTMPQPERRHVYYDDGSWEIFETGADGVERVTDAFYVKGSNAATRRETTTRHTVRSRVRGTLRHLGTTYDVEIVDGKARVTLPGGQRAPAEVLKDDKIIALMAALSGSNTFSQPVELVHQGQVIASHGPDGWSATTPVRESLLEGESLANHPLLAALLGVVCFVEGTLVHTQDGLAPIETIEVGDHVWSQGEHTGEQALRRVVSTKKTPQQQALRLTLESEAGSEELGVTKNHRVYLVGKGWATAKELEPGDVIATRTGKHLQVQHSEPWGSLQTVYNFEVEGFHTYFVGTQAAWVHNHYGDGAAEPDAARPNADSEPAFKITARPTLGGAAYFAKHPGGSQEFLFASVPTSAAEELVAQSPAPDGQRDYMFQGPDSAWVFRLPENADEAELSLVRLTRAAQRGDVRAVLAEYDRRLRGDSGTRTTRSEEHPGFDDGDRLAQAEQRWGNTYGDRYHRRDRDAKFETFLSDMLDANAIGDVVLYAGSGAYPPGKELVHAKGRKIIAADISIPEDFLEATPDTLPVRTDVEQFSPGVLEQIAEWRGAEQSATGAYDTVVVSALLRYVDFRRTLDNLASSLEPGGRLIIEHDTIPGLPDAYDTEVGLFSNDDLLQYLEEAGYEIEHHGSFHDGDTFPNLAGESDPYRAAGTKTEPTTWSLTVARKPLHPEPTPATLPKTDKPNGTAARLEAETTLGEWANGPIQLRHATDPRAAARDFVAGHYVPEGVGLKPTMADFRNTPGGVADYFVGADGAGFAMLPWNDVRFDVSPTLVRDGFAVRQGTATFVNESGEETVVDKTFLEVVMPDGSIRILAHHSSLPHSDELLLTAPQSIPGGDSPTAGPKVTTLGSKPIATGSEIAHATRAWFQNNATAFPGHPGLLGRDPASAHFRHDTITIRDDVAFAQGFTRLTRPDGTPYVLQHTLVYERNADGELMVVARHFSVPYQAPAPADEGPLKRALPEEMLGEAISRVLAMNEDAELRATRLGEYLKEIEHNHTQAGKRWYALPFRTRAGWHVFVGDMGEALVIDDSGTLFRGNLDRGGGVRVPRDGEGFAAVTPRLLRPM